MGFTAFQERKDAIQWLYDETNKGNVDAMHELLAEDFVSYGGAGFQDLHGAEAFINLYLTFLTAFPDLHFKVQQIVVGDDNYAAVRGIQTGTHEGLFSGFLPATGKKVEWTGTAIFRFNDEGKIVERWQDLDNLSLFIQLGVIPPIGGAQG